MSPEVYKVKAERIGLMLAARNGHWAVKNGVQLLADSLGIRRQVLWRRMSGTNKRGVTQEMGLALDALEAQFLRPSQYSIPNSLIGRELVLRSMHQATGQLSVQMIANLVPECGRSALYMHLLRLTGDGKIERIRKGWYRTITRRCTVPECGGRHYALGMCKKHYHLHYDYFLRK